MAKKYKIELSQKEIGRIISGLETNISTGNGMGEICCPRLVGITREYLMECIHHRKLVKKLENLSI